jgi:hypothetical protein
VHQFDGFFLPLDSHQQILRSQWITSSEQHLRYHARTAVATN